MWNEICEGLCARRQGDCRVAVSGAEESAQAYVAGAARAVGAPFAEGKAEFACGGGKVVLTAGGSAGAGAGLVGPVSYTHLTRPTSGRVSTSVVAEPRKKKMIIITFRLTADITILC